MLTQHCCNDDHQSQKQGFCVHHLYDTRKFYYGKKNRRISSISTSNNSLSAKGVLFEGKKV